MKARLKMLVGLTVATLLAGCAGGGGGRGENPTAYYQGILCAALALPADCSERAKALEQQQAQQNSAASSGSSTSSTPSTVSGSSAAPPPTFASLWNQNRTGLVGLATGVKYDDQFQSVGDVTYSQANLQDFSSLRFSGGDLSVVGHPGIDVFSTRDNVLKNSPFGSPDTSYGLIADPHILGWDYQSFGVWRTNNIAGNWVKAASVGAPGAVSVVPLSGAATFTGKLGGLYISPAGQGSVAASDLTVNANFSTRSLSFASTNTITTISQSPATTAPHLNERDAKLAWLERVTGTLTKPAAEGTSSHLWPHGAGTGRGITVKSPATVKPSSAPRRALEAGQRSRLSRLPCRPIAAGPGPQNQETRAARHRSRQQGSLEPDAAERISAKAEDHQQPAGKLELAPRSSRPSKEAKALSRRCRAPIPGRVRDNIENRPPDEERTGYQVRRDRGLTPTRAT